MTIERRLASVTVADIATFKKLPEAELRQFGLSDSPEGVRFAYRLPDGSTARTRLRVGLRGAGGSRWASTDAPIAAYAPPRSILGKLQKAPGLLIVVEGESDCWAAWHHGFCALGIPGANHFDAITTADLAGHKRIAIQVESNTSAETFPEGVSGFVHNVANHILSIGFTGQISTFDLKGVASDLSELHQIRPHSFEEFVIAAVHEGHILEAGTP